MDEEEIIGQAFRAALVILRGTQKKLKSIGYDDMDANYVMDAWADMVRENEPPESR